MTFWIISQITVFILGLCLGSFLNVVIYRLPRDDVSILYPRRSLCPQCGGAIAWYDNLPLISYLVLRGRCRHCQTRISPRYPLVELASGLLVLAVFIKSGYTFKTLAEWYLVLALVAISFIDLEEMVIPDVLTVPGMILGLASAAVTPDVHLIGPWLGEELVAQGFHSLRWLSIMGSGLGLLLGGLVILGIMTGYRVVVGKEGMGSGDATLMAMIGAFLGWRSVLVCIFFSSFIGLGVYLILAIKAREFDLKTMLPFGPFLSLAALIYLFFGPEFLAWYLG